MTETVKLMITHTFRVHHPPLSPHKTIFLIYGPILMRFGVDGPNINGKWLKRLNWWLPIFSGPPPSPQNCIFLIYGPIFIRFGINGPDINVKWLTQTKRKIPTQDGQFPPKTDNSHPRLTIPTQDLPPKKKRATKTTGVNSSFGHIFECSCILLMKWDTIYLIFFRFLVFWD